MAIKIGKNQKKILLLLMGGFSLGLSRSPSQYFKILSAIKHDLKEIDDEDLRKAIKSLYRSKLVREKYNSDGTVTLVLSEGGKVRALTYNLDKVVIVKPKVWDKKWRMVLFDVPEKFKKARDAIRYHLKNMKFYEYQKSVFVHPYDCRSEIEYLIEFYNVKKFVRIAVVDSMDNDPHLKRHFRLITD